MVRTLLENSAQTALSLVNLGKAAIVSVPLTFTAAITIQTPTIDQNESLSIQSDLAQIVQNENQAIEQNNFVSNVFSNSYSSVSRQFVVAAVNRAGSIDASLAPSSAASGSPQKVASHSSAAMGKSTNIRSARKTRRQSRNKTAQRSSSRSTSRMSRSQSRNAKLIAKNNIDQRDSFSISSDGVDGRSSDGPQVNLDSGGESGGLIASGPSSSPEVNSPQDGSPLAYNILPVAFDEDTETKILLDYKDPDKHKAKECSISTDGNIKETTACSCDPISGICAVGVTGVADYNGTAAFKYKVNVMGKESNVAEAHLTISNVDDKPLAVGGLAGTFEEYTDNLIKLPYKDVDGDLATSCSVTLPADVKQTSPCTCDGDGVCTIGLHGDRMFTGDTGIIYTVSANGETSSPEKLEIKYDKATELYYLDTFESDAFTSESGNRSFSSDWVEVGEVNGPSAGHLCAVESLSYCADSSCLVLGSAGDNVNGIAIYRELDLSGRAEAHFGFTYYITGGGAGDGLVFIQVSDDGGSTFNTVDTINIEVADSGHKKIDYDISSFISANTVIRFSMGGANSTGHIFVDNIEVRAK